MKATSTKKEDPTVRILKIATCLSLSGRSTLTYHIGCKEESKGRSEVYFRIYTNTGRGFFSKEWISTSAIQKAFEGTSTTSQVTSSCLNLIFHAKSVNTSGFLIAALKAEGLISNIVGKRRCYQRADSASFVSEIRDLMASPVALNADDKPAGMARGKSKAIQTGKPQKG